jgi:ectoine hydroxylase-related dioxygenase (phytanoyl-CoA dioxygenase family)
MKILSQAQLAGYERDGCLCPVRALSAGEAANFRRSLEEQEAYMGGILKRMDNCHLFFRWAYDLATHPRVLDVLEDLLGPDLFVHSTRIFYKHAHDPSYVSWHQDGRYSSLNSKPAPSAWIALSESTAANGCLRVVPGSHRSGVYPHVETFAADNLLNHGEEIQVQVDESAARDFVLDPGEMSLHHVNMIHGSNPNRSDRCRIGFAVSYMTPAVRQSKLPVVRARGNSEDHEFDLVSQPPQFSLADAVRAHAEFAESRGLQRARVGTPRGS